MLRYRYENASTSLSATGLYSMPYWSSGMVVLAGVVTGTAALEKTSVGGVGTTGVVGGGRVAGTIGTPAISTSGLTQWVIVPSGSRKSTMLITNWLSWASSSGVSTALGGRIDLRS